MNFKAFLEKNESLFLLAFLVFIAPLIVYLELVHYEPAIQNIHGRPNSANFFTYIRSLWLYLLTGTALVLFLIQEKPRKSWAYAPMAVYIFLAVASTVFSQNFKMALWGDTDRNEGLLTILCYMGILFLSINLATSKKAVRFIVGTILISSLAVALIGVFQFFGYDYLYGGFADRYLVPEHFRKIAPDFKVDSMGESPEELIVTFGNGNYTGSYMAMLFALTMGLVVGFAGKSRFLTIPLSLLLFFNLLGSKSRAGMLGAIVSAMLLAWYFRKDFKSKIRIAIFLLGSLFVVFVITELYSLEKNKTLSGNSFNRPALSQNPLFGNFEDLQFENNAVRVTFDGLEIRIRYLEKELFFYDSKDDLIPFRLVNKTELGLVKDSVSNGVESFGELTEKVFSASTSFPDLIKSSDFKESLNVENQFLVLFPESKMRGYVIFLWPGKNLLQIGRSGETFFLVFSDDGFKILDQLGRPAYVKPVETWGFKGYEKFGSGRGYIWSRTLPMLKKTILIGYGPDTFFLHYPNHDYLGKLRHVSRGIQRVIDKPHNMFLQVGVNTGVFSLLALTYLFARFIFQSYRANEKLIPDSELLLILQSINLSLIAYLVAALFNDSVISIAPIFWCLLGLGIALQNFPVKSAEAPANRCVGESNVL